MSSLQRHAWKEFWSLIATYFARNKAEGWFNVFFWGILFPLTVNGSLRTLAFGLFERFAAYFVPCRPHSCLIAIGKDNFILFLFTFKLLLTVFYRCSFLLALVISKLNNYFNI